MRRAALVALAGTVLTTSGCFSTERISHDIRNRRLSRVAAWQSETSGEEPLLPPVKGPLSLMDAVLVALGTSRQIQTALLDKEKSRATVLEAWSEALPTVSVGASYTRYDEVQSFDVAPGVSVTLGDVDNYAVDVTVSQPLFKGGAIGAGIRAARLFSMLTDEQLRGTYVQVIFDVRKAYYDARLALELQRATTQAVEVAGSHLEDVRKNFQAGTRSSFDVLRAEVELKNLLAEQIKDQNQYKVALTNLYNLLGVSQESEVELTDALEYRPFTPAMAQAVEKAFLQHTDILQGELNVRLQAQNLRYTKAGYWPEVNAFFSQQWAKPDPHDQTVIEWGDAWRGGVALTYKLFEGFKTVARVRQARVDYKKSQVALYDTEQRVLLDVRQALLSIEDAERFVVSQQANVQQAEEALRLAALGFSEGISKEIEVEDARNALTSARANYAQAVYSHELARLYYDRATGELVPPVVENKPQRGGSLLP